MFLVAAERQDFVITEVGRALAEMAEALADRLGARLGSVVAGQEKLDEVVAQIERAAARRAPTACGLRDFAAVQRWRAHRTSDGR